MCDSVKETLQRCSRSGNFTVFPDLKWMKASGRSDFTYLVSSEFMSKHLLAEVRLAVHIITIPQAFRNAARQVNIKHSFIIYASRDLDFSAWLLQPKQFRITMLVWRLGGNIYILLSQRSGSMVQGGGAWNHNWRTRDKTIWSCDLVTRCSYFTLINMGSVISAVCFFTPAAHWLNEDADGNKMFVCQGSYVNVRLRSLTRWPYRIIHNKTTTKGEKVCSEESLQLCHVGMNSNIETIPPPQNNACTHIFGFQQQTDTRTRTHTRSRVKKSKPHSRTSKLTQRHSRWR